MQMPVLFISHGSPTTLIDAQSSARKFWSQLALDLPQPKAILVISAHWETNIPSITGANNPSVIYDFFGFPEELYRVQYAAQGAPSVAAQVATLLNDAGLPIVIDNQRGLDHGAWAPLAVLFPKADIPVLQLSVQPGLGFEHHVEMGRALASLRDQGVLILASGAATHNLRKVDFWGKRGPSTASKEFNQWLISQVIGNKVDQLCDPQKYCRDFRQHHPSDEHYLPLLVALGAAEGESDIHVLHDEFELGDLAMTSFGFGKLFTDTLKSKIA